MTGWLQLTDDPQTIYVKYTSLYDPNPYLPDEVKNEVSVRSLQTPTDYFNPFCCCSKPGIRRASV